MAMTNDEVPNDIAPITPSEAVQAAMQTTLNLLNENRSRGRNWAVSITEMEKVYAYFITFASKQ